VALSLRHAVRPAFATPEEDRAVPAAGRAIQSLTAAEEPVVTMHGTGIDLLYYCNRPGWALTTGQQTGRGPSQFSFDENRIVPLASDYRRQGARWLVAVGSEMPHPGPPTVRGEGYWIYRLPAASGSKSEE
jgi:hypothetical protein